jgi:hypothetical protein
MRWTFSVYYSSEDGSCPQKADLANYLAPGLTELTMARVAPLAMLPPVNDSIISPKVLPQLLFC